MKHKLWLKISSIALGLFMLLWIRDSIALYGNDTIFNVLISWIVGLAITYALLYPVFYYAWKKKD